MPNAVRTAWFRTLAQLTLVLATGLGAGFALGHPWPALALTALAVVGFHYWRLQRVLQHWPFLILACLVCEVNLVHSSLEALLRFLHQH